MKAIRKYMFAGLAILALVFGWTPSAGANFDIELSAISTVPDAMNVEEGGKVIIRCDWKATPAAASKVGVGKPIGTGSITVQQTYPVQKTFVIKNAPGLIAQGTYGSKGGEFGGPNPKGMFEGTWLASPAGLYKFACTVSLFGDGVTETGQGTTNNTKFRQMTVTKKAPPPPPPPTGGKLRSPNAKSCAPKMDVWLEVDLSGQDPAKVSPGPKKKVTWPIFASQPIGNTVQCAYGTAAANAMYLMKCISPKKSNQPHTYYCEK